MVQYSKMKILLLVVLVSIAMGKIESLILENYPAYFVDHHQQYEVRWKIVSHSHGLIFSFNMVIIGFKGQMFVFNKWMYVLTY